MSVAQTEEKEQRAAAEIPSHNRSRRSSAQGQPESHSGGDSFQSSLLTVTALLRVYENNRHSSRGRGLRCTIKSKKKVHINVNISQ